MPVRELPRQKNELVEYVCHVAKCGGGMVQVNLYSWNRKHQRFITGCRLAVKAGRMTEDRQTKAAWRNFYLSGGGDAQ